MSRFPMKTRSRLLVPKRCTISVSRPLKVKLPLLSVRREVVNLTVANLIPRFWDVEQGEILIGNVNVKDIATEQLMDLVSFVFQDTFLFYDTLYENIAVGSSKATQIRSIAAARATQCHRLSRSCRTDTKHVSEIKVFSFPVVKHNESVWHGLF